MKMKKYACMIVALAIMVTFCSGVRASAGNGTVRIDSNGGFAAVAASGNGTSDNPWIIEGLDIDGTGCGYCIYVGNTTDHFIIRDCLLHDAYVQNHDGIYRPNAGVVLNNVQNGEVRNNSMEFNAGLGIMLHMSSLNTIQGNNITENEYGIRLTGGSDENNISFNYFWNNTHANIAVENSASNEIGYNTADYSQYGIYLFSATGNLLIHNLAFYNDYGVYCWASADNTAVNNSLCLSFEFGMFLDSDSDDNTIYHNNFGNNTNQAGDSGTGNSWHGGYPAGGNFWTDYIGGDEYKGPDQNETGTDALGDAMYHCPDWLPEALYPRMRAADTFGIGRRDDPNGIGRRDDPN